VEFGTSFDDERSQLLLLRLSLLGDRLESISRCYRLRSVSIIILLLYFSIIGTRIRRNEIVEKEDRQLGPHLELSPQFHVCNLLDVSQIVLYGLLIVNKEDVLLYELTKCL